MFPRGSSVSDGRSTHESFLRSTTANTSSYVDPSITDVLTGKIRQQKLTMVYDMRGAQGSFVRGDTTFHNCTDANSLVNYIQENNNATHVLVEQDNKMASCCILNSDQLTEIHLLVSVPFDICNDTDEEEMDDSIALKVVKCISVPMDECVSFLFDKYTQYTEEVDSMFCSNKQLLVRRETAKEASIQVLSQFDRLHFYEDCPQTLRIVHHIDEHREMVFYLECNKSDSLSDIQAKLSSKFHELQCQDGKRLWITDSTTLLKNSDYIFLQEKGLAKVSDGNLIVHISDIDSVAVQFKFRRKTMVVILPRNAIVRHFRENAGKVLHKAANSLKVLNKKDKCEDSKPILDLADQKTRLSVEEAREKSLTFTMMQNGESECDKVEIKVYKMDTIADVKRKIKSIVGFDPFFIKLVRNEFILKDELTIRSTRIQPSDHIELVICPNRVEITLRLKQVQHSLVVDDITQTTVSDLKNFCGHVFKCDPFNIYIIFKGTYLFNNARTLLDEDVVHGSVLFAVVSCQDNNHPQGVITLFIQGGAGIQKRKAIVHLGRIIIVEDTVKFNDPKPANFQMMQHPKPKGIHLKCSLDRREMSKTPSNTKVTLIDIETSLKRLNLKTMMSRSDMKSLSHVSNMLTAITSSNQELPMTTTNLELSNPLSNQEPATGTHPSTLAVTSVNPIAPSPSTLTATSITPFAPSRSTLAVKCINPFAPSPSTPSIKTCNTMQSGHSLCSEVQYVMATRI